MNGRQLYEHIGKPITIVAPMVDQSELAWRILSRRYGADLCYTPMFHAKLFATQEKHRASMWSKFDGDKNIDRPLVVQFCANDPEYLLQAAKLVEDKCDAVDLNLGCPQGIARRGKYGAFLMDDWDLIFKLIRNLHDNLSIPVTAKIRVYDDWEKSLQYAKMVLEAGAQFITIHGRTRDMKGQKTGLANWKILKHLRDNLPKDQVFFANGNILYSDDIQRCIESTTCDAVMSAEGNLYNPGTFWTKDDDINKKFPRVDKLLREYFEIVKKYNTLPNKISLKSHFFKILHAFAPKHPELRPLIGCMKVHQSSMQEWEKIVENVESIVEKIYEDPNIHEIDVIKKGEAEEWGGTYKEVPYWRCQPYFRKIYGEVLCGDQLKVAANDNPINEENKENRKRIHEKEAESPNKKK
ncbi:unnamed protein product [Candida verbasci]|uniref:tRNA-dihydrouridine(16/17) synthase [NAD(P)(+)] n=1 Tax=Candida verbasci TaxID=1227364 RepID=A0A9W4XGM0_9ASCO|nr:unnamed protein product [Candida verbasci]